jgi:uncharacterized protein YuzE
MPTVRTRYDQKYDVLYVRYEEAKIYTSREHALDPDLVVNYDHERRIIGVQFLWINQVRGMWQVHPARHCLPQDIRLEIDRFVEWLETGPVDPDANRQRRVPPQWVLEAVQAA